MQIHLGYMDTRKFGKRVKDARTSLGLTQQQLADRVGVSRGAVSLWESGEIREIGAEHLMELARALRTSAEWLMYNGDKPPAVEPAPPGTMDPDLADAWALLTPSQRRALIDQAKATAEHNREILGHLKDV